MNRTPSPIHRWLLLALLVLLPACSLKKMALRSVANTLSDSSGGNVFMSDNDPELVADALPFTIKLYETLLQSLPRHEVLRLRTASLTIMYANAFLQTPAELLSSDEHEQKVHLFARAKNLFLRGRNMLLDGLEMKYPGFRKALADKKLEEAKAMVGPEDLDTLYWTGAGWLSAFAIDPFDMKLGITVPQAAALMERVAELDPHYGSGAIHDFYVLYYGALPEYMGGNAAKAREHFALALKAAAKPSGSPYLSLATTVLVNEQKRTEFLDLMNRVLAIDPDKDPQNRLLHVINHRRAQWFKDHVDDFFLEEEPQNPEQEGDA